MPRAIWTGAVSFGLVNVPVRLYAATEQKDIAFHQFEAGTGERIRYKRVAEGTGEEVPFENVVKGYEVDSGRYVIVTPEELAAIEPGQTRTIELEEFVELDAIDPIYYDRPYYLAPAGRAGAAKPYALLRQAMADAGKVGIGSFVLRSKQYLAAVRPMGDVLVLETMLFPDEIRAPNALDDIPHDVELTPRERKIAAQLIDSLTTEWEPARHHDTYREHVLDLIERKARGEHVVTERPRHAAGKVVDLMAALEASLEAVRDGGRQRPDHEEARPRDRRRGRGSATARYAEMTKGQLYVEAKKRDIAGRSEMNRDELIEALSEAS